METKPRNPGRPRGFDRAKAVETAMVLFRKHGYEGVSLAMLTEAIGIAPPSLYAAFGSKAGLYLEALDLYTEQTHAISLSLGDNLSMTEALERFFQSVIKNATGNETMRGCMISTGLLVSHPDHNELQAELSHRRNAFQTRISKNLGTWLNPDEARSLAHFVCAITQGIAVQAQDGATTAQLENIVSNALLCVKNG